MLNIPFALEHLIFHYIIIEALWICSPKIQGVPKKILFRNVAVFLLRGV